MSDDLIPVRVVIRAAADLLGARSRDQAQSGERRRACHDATARLMTLHRDRSGPRPLRNLPGVDPAVAGLLLAYLADWMDALGLLEERLTELGHPAADAVADLKSHNVLAIVLAVCRVPQS